MVFCLNQLIAIFALFVCAINCQYFQYYNLSEKTINTFSIPNINQNKTLHFRFSMGGIVFPTNTSTYTTVFAITIQTPNVLVPIYVRACLPPMEIQVWQNLNNAKFICNQRSNSTYPCSFNVYACDGLNSRGDNYWISIPKGLGVSTLNLTINASTIPKLPSQLISGLTYDSAAPYQDKEYYFKLNTINLQFFMINFRWTVLVPSVLARTFLSIGKDFGDAQPLMFRYSLLSESPGFGYGNVALCSQSQVNATRALGSLTTAYVTLSNEVNPIPTFAIETFVISGSNFPVVDLSVNTPQNFVVPSGKVQFLTFSPGIDRNYYDVSINARILGMGGNSIGYIGFSDGGADDIQFPVFACFSSFSSLMTNTSSNYTSRFQSFSQTRWSTFLIAIQNLAGSANLTFQITASLPSSFDTSTIYDVSLGGPSSPISTVPLTASFSNYVMYRIPFNSSLLSPATQIRVVVSNISSSQSATQGRISMSASRSGPGYSDILVTCTTNLVSTCQFTWNPCGQTHISSSPDNFIFVLVRGFNNTTKWSLSASIVNPSPVPIPIGSAISVSSAPSQPIFLPFNIGAPVTVGTAILISGIQSSGTGQISVSGLGNGESAPNGDQCYINQFGYLPTSNVTAMSSILFGCTQPTGFLGVSTFSPSATTQTNLSISVLAPLSINLDSPLFLVSNGNGFAGYYRYVVATVAPNLSFSISLLVVGAGTTAFFTPWFMNANNCSQSQLIGFGLPASSSYNFSYVFDPIPSPSPLTIVVGVYADPFKTYQTIKLVVSQSNAQEGVATFSSIQSSMPYCGNVLSSIYNSNTLISIETMHKRTIYSSFYVPPAPSTPSTRSWLISQSDKQANASTTALDAIYGLNLNGASACQMKYRQFTCSYYFPLANSTDFSPVQTCLEDCLSIMDVCGYNCAVNNTCTYYNELSFCVAPTPAPTPPTPVPTPEITPQPTPPTPPTPEPTPEPTPPPTPPTPIPTAATPAPETDSQTQSTTATTSSTPTETLTNSNLQGNPSTIDKITSSSSSSSMVGVIVGILIGICVILVLVAVGVVLYRRYTIRKEQNQGNNNDNEMALDQSSSNSKPNQYDNIPKKNNYDNIPKVATNQYANLPKEGNTNNTDVQTEQPKKEKEISQNRKESNRQYENIPNVKHQYQNVPENVKQQ